MERISSINFQGKPAEKRENQKRVVANDEENDQDSF